MTKFSFSEIEGAFMYVGSAMYGMNSAVVCKDTGKILYHSDMAGIDEIEDEDDLDWDQCIEIPHKNDLDLGRHLVFEFVEEYLPDDYERVRQMFRRSAGHTPVTKLYWSVEACSRNGTTSRTIEKSAHFANGVKKTR